MCIKIYISPFLILIWRYRFVDKDRQQDPPSLPFARPEQSWAFWVVDQELLLCRLHLKCTRFISKFSTAIRMYRHVLSTLLLSRDQWGLLAISDLGRLQDRTDSQTFCLSFIPSSTIFLEVFERFCKEDKFLI